ncbi:SdrD B-like domain-containing protein [Phaeodactylibacter xiamenensis]|uniref:SdrD B-like domain-containing protein n=1 Tax=Phaeodactylibacter xiamenensis TaxID=1524460 RepID=UPI003BACC380
MQRFDKRKKNAWLRHIIWHPSGGGKRLIPLLGETDLFLKGVTLLVLLLLLGTTAGNNLFGQCALEGGANATAEENRLASISDGGSYSVSVPVTTAFPNGLDVGPVFNSIYINANGTVTFFFPYEDVWSGGLPIYDEGPIISAQHDGIEPAFGGDIYFYQNSQEGYAVITYNEVAPGTSNLAYGTSSDRNTFQIILRQGANYANDDSDFIIELRYQEINWVGKNPVAAGYSPGFTTGYALVSPYSSPVININGTFEATDATDGTFAGIVNGSNTGSTCTYQFAGSGLEYADEDGDGFPDYIETNQMPPNFKSDPCLPDVGADYLLYNVDNTTWSMADCDGDGVDNGSEVTAGTNPYSVPDSDNDGILDIVETQPCNAASPTSITGFSGILYDAPDQDSWSLLNGSSSFPGSAYTAIATFEYNEFAGQSNAFSVDFGGDAVSLSTNPDISNYIGSNISTDGNLDHAIQFNKVVQPVEEGVYQFDLDYGDDHVFIYLNGVKQYGIQNAYGVSTNDGLADVSNVATLTLKAGDTLTYLAAEEFIGNTAIKFIASKISQINGDSPRCLTDTDDDGVPDHLDYDSDNDGVLDVDEAAEEVAFDIDGNGVPNYIDTDSDGDGCFDAVEASGIVSSSALDNDGRFLGSVDENGVPLAVAAIGEGAIGLSITDEWQDDEVCVSSCDIEGGADATAESNRLSISDSDDDYEVVSLTTAFPNGITIGGETYEEFSIGTNGYVTFGHSSDSYDATGLAGYEDGPIVAAMYDDWDPSDGGDIYYYQNAAEGYVVVTYYEVAPYDEPPAFGTTSDRNTAQIILRRGANYATDPSDFLIELRYQAINWVGANNEGVASAGWSAGDLWTYEQVAPYSVAEEDGPDDMGIFSGITTGTNIGTSCTYQWAGSVLASIDTDEDGLVDLAEQEFGSDPNNPDTDGDGVTDGSEYSDDTDFLDPCDPAQDAGYTGYDADNAIWAAGDCDDDLIPNGEELDLGTDPYNEDTDGDGTDDALEDEGQTDPLDPCDPVKWEGYTGYDADNAIWAAGDCDDDGLSNGEELGLGTDPYNADTDGDGIEDGSEDGDNTDPLDPCDPAQDAGYTGYDADNDIWGDDDCDGDGLINSLEHEMGTDPYNADTDGDGIEDGSEDGDNTDPLDSCDPTQDAGYTGYDADNGIWAAGDCDDDLIPNGEELGLGTDPYNEDTDGDGTDDALEDEGQTDPLDPCDPVKWEGYTGYDADNAIWAGGDCDGDLILNGDELDLGTDPYNEDTDGDGVPDGQEVADGTSPLELCEYEFASVTLPKGQEWNAADCDGDGLDNELEGDELVDTDGDLIPDFFDLDSDNDGIPDADESSDTVAFDIDGDGTPNYLDLDSDGDGCFDAVEASDGLTPADLSGGRIPGEVNGDGIPLAVLEGEMEGLEATEAWGSDEIFSDFCGSDLGGFVWLDNDRNGLFLQQQPGLPGISSMPSSEEVLPGVQVRLFGTDLNGNPVDEVQAADADGYYLFELVLAGDYCMEVSFEGLDNAEDYVLTIPNVEFNTIDSLDSDYSLEGERCFTLEAGAENVYDLNAGVFLDADGDFIPDVNDPDIGGEMLDPQGFIYCENTGEIISGAAIEVTGPGNVTMVADGSTGFYQWFVDASGVYTMTLTTPSGYGISTDCTDSGQLDPEPGITIVGSSEEAMSGFMEDASCGANPFYMEFVLSPGDLVLNNNLPLVCAEIGDRAWKDFDRDGLQSPGEPGLGYTEVRLLDCAGNGVDTVVSDIEGRFLFTGLPAGGYVLDYEGRAEWAGTLPNLWSYAGYQAGSAELDSDITASGSTECVTLGVGEKNYTVDGGYEVPYTYSCNCDGSITLEWSPVSGEPGVTYTVDIEDSAGNPVLDYVNMTETSVTIAHGTLQNGEEYRLAITENISTSNVVSITGPLYADCNPVPMASVISAAGPACPGGTDGSVLFELEESGCAGRYAVYLEQAGSDILVAADTTLANSFSVSGLGEGSYSLRVELLDTLSCGYGVGCFPLEVEDFVVLSNQDSEAPALAVSTIAGVPVDDVSYTAPEGECGVQLEWLAEVSDNCAAGDAIALSVSIESDVAGVSPWAAVAPLSSQGSTVTSVYLLSSGDASNDNLMAAQLESTGRLSVAIGEEFWEMDGTEDLSAYDVVFLQANFNWNNPLSADAAANLTAYVENGGGLVTSEWSVWNAAYNTGSGSWDALLPIFPVDLAEINGYDYLGETDVTYTSVNSEPLVNDGVSSSFVFTPSDASGTVSLFTAKAGATVFYDMSASYDGYDFTAVGMAGWEYQSGRVFSFNGTNGATEIANDANLRQLLINALSWSSGPTAGYAVSVHAGIGTNTVVLTATDEAGNSTELSYEITVVDNRAPEIYGPGDMQVQIPGCEDGMPVNWQMSVIDDCDLDVELVQISGPQPGDVLAPGVYTVVYEATDDYGNTSQYSFDITLTQAQSPAPIVDVSGNGQFVIEDCAEDGFIVFAGHIYDCELQAGDVPDGLISISGAPLEITYILVNEGYAYFEATGNLSAGSYLIVTSYEGVTIDHAVEVVQGPDTPAVMTMPGNLAYQVPNCEGEAAVSFAVQLEDDCDEDFGTASFTVNGAPAPPFDAALSDPANGYFAWSLSLSPGVYTIVGTYTDGGGNTTEATATITVNAEEDNSAPIIVYPSQNINIALDPCIEAAVASQIFQVTAIDNCDGDLDPTVTVSSGTGTVTTTPGGYVFMGGPGVHTITTAATDAAGNSRTESFSINVTQAPAPQENLACNDDINVTLDDNCSRVITADMVLEGNFGCFEESDFTVTIVNDDNPANGNILDGHGQFIYEIELANQAQPIDGFTSDFAAGNWDVIIDNTGFFGAGFADVTFSSNTLTLETLAGGVAQASIAMPGEGTLSFDYDYNGADPFFDFFMIDLNGNVVADVTNPASGSFSEDVEAGWVLVFAVDDDGFNPFGPAVPSTAEISNFGFAPAGPVVSGFEPCWGFVTGEDKTAPVVDCPDDTDVATISEPVQKIQGALETTDAQLELADYSCFLDGAGPVAGGQYYDIIEFQVSADDIYTIYLNTSWGDGFTALYQGSFDADSPCENILYAADDNILGNAGPIGGLFDPQVRVTLPLRAYETYFVLVSSFGSDVTGSYEHTIFSDGNGLVGAWNFTETMLPDWTIQYDTTFSALPSTTEQLSIPLFCDDFGQIYGGDAGSVAQETAFIQGTYQWVGAPSATDNCDNNVDITATDSFTSSGDCGDVVITRTFTATDDQGLTDECQQEITVRKPTLDDVNFPSFTAVVECDEDYPALANGNPSPELTGYPFIFTAFGIFDIAPSYCNIGASYEDLPTVDECEGRFKFRREWTIFDWCDPGSSLIANQLIKVGDYTAPEVSCPAGTPIAYSTSPFSCGASFEVPMPGVSDNCSNVTVYTEIVTTTEEEVINQYGLPTGQFVTDTVVVRTIQPGANRFVSSIPFGGHFFRYVAEDDCGNETELYCPFSVIDDIEPVAVCDDQLNVSIGGGNIVPGQPALARVFASDVDEGSWDNCGDVSIAIFRNNFNPITYTCGTQNSVTGDFVDFFCCDVGVTSDITLVVTDQYGNQNSCWLSVTPEDKINPFCDAPDNVVVDCDDLPYGFDASDAGQLEDLFGMATGADNCGVASVQQVASNADLECGYGSITRIFRVTDVNGLSSTNSCVQVITINEVHNYEIYFPEDAEANCGTPTPDTVEYNELGCDLLAVTSNDEQFSASGDECYKIFRTWKVINWCQYDGESDPYIVGRDEDCNGVPGDGDRIANNGNGFWLLARPNGKIYFDQDTDETPDNNVPGINFCGVSNDYYSFEYDETGYYQYTQIIKVYDDTAPEISFTQADAFCSLDNVNCDANVTYPFSIDEDCTPDGLTIKVFLDPFLSGDLVELTGVVSGSYPDYTITVNGLPIGSHAFEVHVLDGCGNSDLAILPFDIIDCKAPAPFCLNGIAIELMPVDEDGDNLPDPGAGMAEIWASDFVDFSTQAGDCSEPIKYSINRVGEPNNPDQAGLVLTCDDEGTLVIEIWAYDAAGNSDFCETYILVQDNMGVCGAAAPMAAGAVNTEDNEPVEDVQVSLSGQASTAMTTQNDGAYVFTNLTSGLDYTITPQRDGDYLNGVSTFDLVLISKHILGVGPLSTPYQRIAADVNNSGSITTLDLIQLRKLILSIDTEFANNTSWRFVETAYVFPDPSNPWAEQFPEVININDLPATSIMDADFVAVKIGDVNGDAAANSFAVVDERSYEGTFALQTDEQELKAGNEYRVSFTAAELARIEGYQATLTLSNGVELVDIVSGVATEDNFGLSYLGEGMITTSWHWASGASAKAPTGIELFTLVLRANSDVMLSEVLGVSSAVTKAEAYGKDGSFQDVAIEFSTGTVAGAGFELYQNQPNPFKGETVIGFNLPEAAQVTVTISDVTGKVLKLYRHDGSKGYNHITVKSSELAATGVVQYTVSTGTHSATKRMVIVE